jgi:hypothetical protein
VVLAGDVPQRLVDAGDGAHQDRPAPVEAGPAHDLPVVLDLAGVLTNQVVRQFVHGGGDGGGPPFHHRLAPAGDALVGLDLQEQPARRDSIRGEPGNLHA